MKLIYYIILIVVILAAFFLWRSCAPSQFSFSGKVVDKAGNPIPEASVKIGDKETQTTSEGEFKLGVKKLDRYALNVSKLGFGFISKIYTDTASGIIITMAKATVVTKDPNQDIVVVDNNPDMTVPASAQPFTPSSPLDTIPFVYDGSGHLVSFKMPKELKAAYNSVSQFQAPTRGAMISIPAKSLVLDGTDRLPDGDIQVSVNTIDLYTPDGMPGDYTVNLGDNQQGYMVSYGAANIEAFYNGKPLQLGGKKTATLTIPVDTLSIISRDSIPDEIPFLVYNKATGLWDKDGTAKLNESRDAYTKEVSHFSTFNLDMVFSGQSCIQICDKTTPAASLEITVPTKTKTLPLPGSPICAGGTTDCNVFGIGVANTHAIINLQNNIAVGVRVIKSGMPVSTYAFLSGPAPSGSSSVYQSCNYNDCYGPFQVADANACWETSPADGTMTAPILGVARGKDLNGDNVISNDALVDRNGDALINLRDNENNYFVLSWIFVEAITGNAITNGANFYRVFYQTFNAASTFSFNAATWSKVDFDIAVAQQETFPALSAAGTTEWRIEQTAPFLGIDAPSNTASNPVINATDIVAFRVDYSTDGVNFTDGVFHAYNMPGSGTFYTSFTALTCYTN